MAQLRWLTGTGSMAVGLFSCAPGEEVWAEEHEVTMDPLLTLPLSSWQERGRSGRCVVATPAEAVISVPGWRYRRDPIGGQAAVSVLVLPSEAAASDRLLRSWQSGRAGPLIGPEAAAAIRGVARPDPTPAALFALEEQALGLLGQLIPLRRTESSIRASTRNAHRRAVDVVRSALADEPAATLSLTELGELAGYAPFHLARVFRDVTGTSIARYRERLRLNAALCLLSRPEVEIARIALDLGFSSHAHFTDRFTRMFGVPPSRMQQRFAPRS
jgi:AraC-like DNA-binding protein